jgi:glyoxylase-like metal-dependent hydrolase (beta-lactamase superfamily II)
MTAPDGGGIGPLVRTRQVGDVRIHAIEAGTLRLDGGAMFGVVPKSLWERRIPADGRNRITLSLRCLLIEGPEALVLVDTGVGNKGDPKFQDIYGIKNEGDPTRLEDAIRAVGFAPGDIDIVLMTHLHFDHAGGGTMRRDDGVIVPSFPEARYVVQSGELEESASRNERIRSSYLQDDIEPVLRGGLWDPVAGDRVLTRGVRLLRTPGHTPHHQSVLVESAGETACFLADVCPTSAHVPLTWTMAYDLEPLVTMESKRGLWRRAAEEEWLLIFQHDERVPFGRLDEDQRGVTPS